MEIPPAKSEASDVTSSMYIDLHCFYSAHHKSSGMLFAIDSSALSRALPILTEVLQEMKHPPQISSQLWLCVFLVPG